MRIVLGADHGGFEKKETAKRYIESLETHEIIDKGPYEVDPADNYPVFAEIVCEAIINGEAERALLFCTTGIGMAMAAGVIPGIFAANPTPGKVESAVKHNGMNVMAVSSEISDRTLYGMIDTFLSTEPEGGRHAQRRDFIETIRKKYST